MAAIQGGRQYSIQMVKHSIRILAAAFLLLTGISPESSAQMMVRDMNYAVDSINRYFAGKATVTSKVAIDTFFIKKVKRPATLKFISKNPYQNIPSVIQTSSQSLTLSATTYPKS